MKQCSQVQTLSSKCDNKNAKIARVEGEDYLKAGSAFLLLINELR